MATTHIYLDQGRSGKPREGITVAGETARVFRSVWPTEEGVLMILAFRAFGRADAELQAVRFAHNKGIYDIRIEASLSAIGVYDDDYQAA